MFYLKLNLIKDTLYLIRFFFLNVLQKTGWQSERPSTAWEKVFANHISYKWLVSQMYKEFSQLNQKINNLVQKQAKVLSRHLSKYGIQMASEHMKRSSISNHKGNANQNHSITSHTY